MHYLKLSVIMLAATALLAASCNKDGGDGTRLQFQPQRIDVPAGLNPILAHNFTFGELSTEHARFDEESGVPWPDWARVEPARASLIITEPGLDWSFAFEVTLKGYATDPNRQVELFYRDQIPRNIGARLDMIPSDFNAKEILNGSTFGLVLELRRLETSPPQSLPVRLEYSFEAYEEE